MSNRYDTLTALCRNEKDFLVTVRRYLHTNPELSGQEVQAIAFLCGCFARLGIPYEIVQDGGILATIRGGNVSDPENRPTLLIRADCDALPVTEELHDRHPRTCISEKPGVCHACGHDAHTAVLMAAAKVLWNIRDTLPGDVIVMIERSEEVPYNKCLLRLMQALEKKNQRIDGVWGMHCAPAPAGQIQLNDGSTMAGTIFFDFALQGKGGHGSRPDLSRNPIDCFSAIHSMLSQLPVRLVNPFYTSSIAVTYVRSGAKNNVIAPDLTFGGTARFFDVADGFRFQTEINRITESTGALYGCSVSGRAAEPFLPLVNHPACVETARKAFADSPLADMVTTELPSMAAETFATMACKYPAAFIHYGIGCPDGLHTPTFDVDEDCLPDASAAAVIYADAFLSSLAQTDSRFGERLAKEKPQYYDKTAEELFLMQGISSDQ